MSWERGGVGLPENRSAVVKGLGLVIDTVKVQDTGTYLCKATNILGTKTKTIILEVHSKSNLKILKHFIKKKKKKKKKKKLFQYHLSLIYMLFIFLALRLSVIPPFKR